MTTELRRESAEKLRDRAAATRCKMTVLRTPAGPCSLAGRARHACSVHMTAFSSVHVEPAPQPRVVEGGDDDDRRPHAALAQRLGDLEAVHLRQREVEQHDVRRRLGGALDGGRAVEGDLGLEAPGDERLLERCGDVGMVLDHQHPRAGAGSLGSIAGQRRPLDVHRIVGECEL